MSRGKMKKSTEGKVECKTKKEYGRTGTREGT